MTSSPRRAPGSQQQHNSRQQHHRTELSQTAWHQPSHLLQRRGVMSLGLESGLGPGARQGAHAEGGCLPHHCCHHFTSTHSFIQVSLHVVVVVTWFKFVPSQFSCWSVKRAASVRQGCVSLMSSPGTGTHNFRLWPAHFLHNCQMSPFLWRYGFLQH